MMQAMSVSRPNCQHLVGTPENARMHGSFTSSSLRHQTDMTHLCAMLYSHGGSVDDRDAVCAAPPRDGIQGGG